MSCLNPILMIQSDWSDVDHSLFLKKSQMFRDRHYLVDTKKQFIYKIVAKESRSLPLEKIFEAYDLPSSCSKILELPCRHCIGCRLDYSKDWANRCSFEAEKYEFNYFITLTYDEDHVLFGSSGNETLSKEDLDVFIHKVRDFFRLKFKHLGVKVFGCGEYGDNTWRPHYHVLFFNLPLYDLTEAFPSDIEGSFVKKLDSLGVPMKFSETIYNLWGKGIVTIQPFSWNAGAYVSKYILKKQIGEGGTLYKKLGVLPPFLKFSKGIGKDYIYQNKDKLINNPVVFVSRDHQAPLVCGLPFYYKKILKHDFPDEYESIIESCKEFSEHQRSLLKDVQLINDNRIAKEDKLVSNSSIPRDLKNKF